MSTPGIVSVSVIINKSFHSPTEPRVIKNIHFVVNQFFGADVLILSLSNEYCSNNNLLIIIYLFILINNFI